MYIRLFAVNLLTAGDTVYNLNGDGKAECFPATSAPGFISETKCVVLTQRVGFSATARAQQMFASRLLWSLQNFFASGRRGCGMVHSAATITP